MDHQRQDTGLKATLGPSDRTSLNNNTTSSFGDSYNVNISSEGLQKGNGTASYNRQPTFQLEDRYIDEPRVLKVVVIGAGLAGITAGIMVPAKVPGIDLTIYEKNDDVVRSPE
jgi:hypothetical protein